MIFKKESSRFSQDNKIEEQNGKKDKEYNKRKPDKMMNEW